MLCIGNIPGLDDSFDSDNHRVGKCVSIYVYKYIFVAVSVSVNVYFFRLCTSKCV